MTPREVDQCSMAELDAAVAGWNRVHGAEERAEAPTSDRFDQMVQKVMKE
jgi:hypothetical protein